MSGLLQQPVNGGPGEMQPLPLRQHLRQVLLVEALVGGLGLLHHPPRQPHLHCVRRPLAPVPVRQCAGPFLPVPRTEPPQLAFRQSQKLPRPGWAQHTCLQLVQHQPPPLLSLVQNDLVLHGRAESLNF